ncbi:PILR alpha-associated neural protein isoform X4 [Triplophysa rosa]|uniref:PILR alpha-associated neural protein isoform X4 n=1 Tax=Triplophysa rosa TaxID=992332 RepID=UPI002545FB1A|nr:PILR alpha-associated neural protein isoform X4 [Triplophysa rosa]
MLCVLYAYLAFSFQSHLPSFRCFVCPSPSSISPHIGFIPLWSFLLVPVIFCTATSDTNDRKWEELGEMQMPVTAQATTTQLWAVVWGPTQPLEDETHHFLSSLETESLKMTTSEDLSHHRGQPANQTQQPTTGEEERKDTGEQETQEVMTGASLIVLLLSLSPSLAP